MDALKQDTEEKVAKTNKTVCSSSQKTPTKQTNVKKPEAAPKQKPKPKASPKKKEIDPDNPPPKRRRRKNDVDGTFEENKEKVEFICSVCGIVFAKKEILQSHFIRKHTDGFNFTCDDCGKQFKLKGDLTTHTRLHHLEPPTVCDVCGKTYKNSLSLYVHQKYAHYKARFECQFCKRRMVSQENLDQHITVMHEQHSRSVCEECGKTFTKKVSLRRHVMNVHSNIKSYICPVCNKAFSQTYHMRQHLLLHTGKRLFICDICGKQFAQKPGLLSHRKVHPGEHPPLPVIRLDNVLKEFLKKESLKGEQTIASRLRLRKRLNKSIDDLKTKPRIVQEKRFKKDSIKKQQKMSRKPVKRLKPSSSNLSPSDLSHSVIGMVNDEPENNKPPAPKRRLTPTVFICSDCGTVFFQRKMLQTHINREHSKIEPKPEPKKKQNESGKCKNKPKKPSPPTEFICEVCQAVFLRKVILQDHIARIHLNKYNFPCKECDKKFKVRSDLTTHKKLHSDPPAVCDTCGKIYTNSRLLYMHQRHSHYETKFPCPHCKRFMASQENLDLHISYQHNRTVRLDCEMCTRSFASTDTLRRHVQTVHLQIKSFACEICDKRFARSSELRSHLLIHTGKRLFLCDICGKRFTQKPGLHSHRKLHPGKHAPLPTVRLDAALSTFKLK